MACSNEVGKRLVVAVVVGRGLRALLREEVGGQYGYGEWLRREIVG
jgi:hypothetical protein